MTTRKADKARGVYERIRKIIEDARGNIVRVVNTEWSRRTGTLDAR
jgi:hypothetical protein